MKLSGQKRKFVSSQKGVSIKKLENKIVFITGGNSGIGFAAALQPTWWIKAFA
jgi:hypothetical protein